MEITYRDALIDDLPELKELGIKSYDKYREILSYENFMKLEAYLNSEEELLKLFKKSKCFIAADLKIVGMAYFIPNGNPTEIYDSKWSYIRMVGVDPLYTGRGIAKRLTQMCIRYAKCHEETIIALHTSDFMDPARYIYESCGFTRVKELAPIFGNKYWLYHLQLI